MAPQVVDVLLAELERDGARRAQFAEVIGPEVAQYLAPAAPPPDSWLDTAGAADYLGISRTALHKLTAAREIPFEQDGPRCKCWFKRSELDAWRRGEWGRQTAVPLRSASKSLPNEADQGMAVRVAASKNPA
jgi:excisionase family DNA binding protein